MLKINPWRGLQSYTDPEKTVDTYSFCGRESAVNSIFALIDNNLVVTMYGKTGIGKTSLLNAGVFPLLRSRRYLPISIRLGQFPKDGSVTYAKIIVETIAKEMTERGYKISTSHSSYATDNYLNIDFLWKYFLTTIYCDSEGHEVYPVIALDQFEEIFFCDIEEASLLLRQIYALLDDNRVIPQLKGFSDRTNFRFIISIREDDLFYLEDCIDFNHLSALKQNRYRLGALNDDEAQEVVMLGKKFMELGSEKEIAIRIANLAKDENGHISTNILSLVCSQLFVLTNGSINGESLNAFSENPLEEFCKECMAHVDYKTRLYIENNLIDQDRRKFVSKKDFEHGVSAADIKFLMIGEYRILQKVMAGNTECVELIHDSIAKTLYHLKSENDELLKNEKLAKHNKRFRIGVYVLSFVVFVAIMIIAYLSFVNNDMKNKGYVSTKTFVINVCEDSLVAIDNYYWEGNLKVTGMYDKREKTTQLLKMDINKSDRNTPIEFNVDSAYKVRVQLEFQKGSKYCNVDTLFNVSYLIEHPSIRLLIKRKNTPYTYTSKVFMSLNGDKYGLQDAIVILRDQICRTDKDGYFSFSFDDSLNTSDAIYIVRKGFRIFESNNVLENKELKPCFEIEPSDSLQSFKQQCMVVDSIKRWGYCTRNKVVPRGPSVSIDGKEQDYLILYGKVSKKMNSTIYIWGYYYYQNDYNKKKERGIPYAAYYIFSGFMDSTDLMRTKKSCKPFEIQSYNMVGNKQRIKGLFYRSGKWSGDIFIGDEWIGKFH